MGMFGLEVEMESEGVIIEFDESICTAWYEHSTSKGSDHNPRFECTNGRDSYQHLDSLIPCTNQSDRSLSALV